MAKVATKGTRSQGKTLTKTEYLYETTGHAFTLQMEPRGMFCAECGQQMNFADSVCKKKGINATRKTRL